MAFKQGKQPKLTEYGTNIQHIKWTAVRSIDKLTSVIMIVLMPSVYYYAKLCVFVLSQQNIQNQKWNSPFVLLQM